MIVEGEPVMLMMAVVALNQKRIQPPRERWLPETLRKVQHQRLKPLSLTALVNLEWKVTVVVEAVVEEALVGGRELKEVEAEGAEIVEGVIEAGEGEIVPAGVVGLTEVGAEDVVVRLLPEIVLGKNGSQKRPQMHLQARSLKLNEPVLRTDVESVVLKSFCAQGVWVRTHVGMKCKKKRVR